MEGREVAIRAGSGSQVLGRSLPLGWTVDDYESQQIGPEQFIWFGQDSIIFSKNVQDSNAFEYSKGKFHSTIVFFFFFFFGYNLWY
jgi:hypothetical protein